MDNKSCKGCKREETKDRAVVISFCTKCKRLRPATGITDYYERKK